MLPAPCYADHEHFSCESAGKSSRVTPILPRLHLRAQRFDLTPETIQITQIDDCHATVYSGDVIKTFADKATYELYHTGRSRQFPPDIRKRVLRRLEYLDLAATLEDLKVPPSNRLHQLSRDRAGQYSISVNDQWRICFRFVDGDVYDVELTDYH